MPKISLCMIVKDEARTLPHLLASVAPHVDEIIIADTGSSDDTKAVAERLGARVLDCNPTTHPSFFFRDDVATMAPLGVPGPFTDRWCLGDFGGARAFSLEHTTGDYVMWLDADDELVGGEHLRATVDQMIKDNIDVTWLKYFYAFDHAGRPACELWRERIIRRGSMRWVNPIHEVMVPVDPTTVRSHRSAVMSVHHRRTADRTATVALRNYKVLVQHLRHNPDDARTLFYFGNEARVVNPDQAIVAYERYVELSGWPEERATARCYVGEMLEQRRLFGRAYAHFSAATVDCPTFPDGWFGLARLAFHRNDWPECCRLTEEGLRRGNPDAVIMVNPMSRTFAPYLFYSLALNSLGRVQEAHDAALAGLRVIPEDHAMRNNLAAFRRFLDERIAEGAPAAGPLSEPAREGVAIAIAPASATDAPRPLSAATLERAALRIWKELLALDESIKAQEFLEALPYSIAETPAIEEARLRTRAITAHLYNDDLNRSFILSAPASEAIPIGTELTANDHPSQYVRWRAIVDALPVGHLRILDVGCQDGWIANRLARLGHDVVGVDLSPDHLEIARRNASNLNLNARFIVGNFESLLPLLDGQQFDVVICTEVIEHLLAPNQVLRDLWALMRRDGTLIVTTPMGAWLGGQQLAWAPKWDQPKEHVRCWTQKSLGQALARAGFDAVDLHPVPISIPDVPGQATLVAVARSFGARDLRAPRPGKDIVIWTGPAVEPWTPRSPATTGIGGSETAAIEMARHLTAMGHRVRVYLECGAAEGLYGGVQYHHWSKFTGADCDVFISSRQPQVMDHQIRAKLKLLWVHDVHCGQPDPSMHRWLLKFDRILCLTEWHKNYFRQVYPWLHDETVVVTRNGIDPARFAALDVVVPAMLDDPHAIKSKLGSMDYTASEVLPAKLNRAFYSSSPNRGLDVLMDLWPRVVAEVPDAELHVFYGFESWEASARMANNTAELDLIAQYRKRLAETPGVVWRGRVSQTELAREMMLAKVWAYPTAFTETYCCTAIEAQAAGCLPITSAVAALGETALWGIRLSGHNTDPAYQSEWVQNCVAAMKDETARATVAQQGRAWALQLTWSSLAREWDQMFDRLIDDVTQQPVPRYVQMGKSAA